MKLGTKSKTKTTSIVGRAKAKANGKPANGRTYVRHVPTRTPLKQCDPKGCQYPDAKSCPLVSGQAKPYRYQLGCRAEACINANSRYYKRLAKDGPAQSNSKSKRRRSDAKRKVANALKKSKSKR